MKGNKNRSGVELLQFNRFFVLFFENSYIGSFWKQKTYWSWDMEFRMKITYTKNNRFLKKSIDSEMQVYELSLGFFEIVDNIKTLPSIITVINHDFRSRTHLTTEPNSARTRCIKKASDFQRTFGFTKLKKNQELLKMKNQWIKVEKTRYNWNVLQLLEVIGNVLRSWFFIDFS